MIPHLHLKSHIPSIRQARWPIPLAVLLVITFVTLRAAWPLWSGWLIKGHDGQFHVWRLFELDRAIHAGVLYPRLAPDMAMGLGYPVYNYYAPLASYVGEIGKLAGLSYIYANNSIFILSLVLGVWGMFFLVRRRFGTLAGAAGATAYALAPYSIADVFIRAAQAEALAMGLLPWVLLLFERLAGKPSSTRMITASLGMALLLLAHNITALFSLPLIGAYYALVAWEHPSERPVRTPVIQFTVAVALALGLTAFFWMPALLEQSLVQIKNMTREYFELKRHFSEIHKIVQGTLSYDYSDNNFFRPGLVQMLLATLGFVTAIWLSRDRRRVVFFGLAVAFTLWLQTSSSQSLWERVPFAQFVQFPWRMMVFMTLATAWLTGALVGSLRQLLPASSAWPLAVVRPAATCVIVAAFGISSGLHFYVGAGNNADYQLSVPTLMRGELYRQLVAVSTQGEYLPATVETNPFRYLAGLEPRAAGDTVSDAEVRVTDATPFQTTLSVRASRPTRLVLDHVYFPGWRAETTGERLEVEPSGPLGQLSFTAPPGDNTITVSFGDTPVRTIGTLTSALALSAVLVVVCYNPRWRLGRRLRSLRLPGLTGALLGVWLVGYGMQMAVPWALAGVVTGASSHSFRQLPVHAVFGKEVELAGATLDNTLADQRGTMGIILYWHVLQAPLRDYQVRLRLIDENGTTAGERVKRPMFGLRRSTLWETGMVVRDYQEIRLSPGMPPGSYRLAVSLVDESTGGPLPVKIDPDSEGPVSARPDTPGAGSAPWVFLGNVTMPASRTSVAPVVDHPLDANFAGKMLLRGFSIQILNDVSPARVNPNPANLVTVQEGDMLRLTVSMETLVDLDEDYSVFNHLLDSQGQMVSQQDDQPARGNRPTSVWYPGDTYAEPFQLSIPKDVAPGRYALVTGFYTRVDMKRLPLEGRAGESITLGYVKVKSTANRDSYQPVAGGPPVFGGLAGLEGLNIVAGEDNRLKVGLLWSSRGVTAKDYTVFVHITDRDGRLIAQDDGMPAKGSYPTSSWDPGDLVEDIREMTLPPGTRCSEYRVEVGMYLVESGQRLSLPDGRDSPAVGMVPGLAAGCAP